VPTSSIDAWIDNGGRAQIFLPNADANGVFVGISQPDRSFLEITSGGELSNSYGHVGYQSQGTATVTGIGSKWTNSGNLSVGFYRSGTLTITDAAQVSNRYGYLGYVPGSQGMATVAGTGSKWTNSGDLCVGRYGAGTLTIADAAEVSNQEGYLGYESRSLGAATVTGTSSKWTNSGGLYVGDEGTGTLTITDRGEVSSSSGYLGRYSGAQGTASVSGSGSKWTNSRGLYVGDEGTGTLTITDRGEVSSSYGILGRYSGAQGTATVTGSGSKWTNSGHLNVGSLGTGTLEIIDGGQVSSADLYVGEKGTGTLSITDGGQVSSSSGCLGRYSSGSHGTVIVTGSGSNWTNSDELYVGRDGTGTLSITDGGQVSSSAGWLGRYSGAQGTATVTGSGSKWTNSGGLSVGREGTGTLEITDGAEVSASIVSIGGKGLLAMDVGQGSLLTVGRGTGTLTNWGAVRLLAGAGPNAGAQFQPILAGSWQGSGTYQSIGGSWDGPSRTFTVSPVIEGQSGQPVVVGQLLWEQRVRIEDDPTGWGLGASFLNKPGELIFTASPVSSGPLDALEALLEPGHTVLGAWEMSASGSGYSPGDPVFLSFDIGGGFARSDFDVWHYDGSQWAPFETDVFSYDGRYASMLVTGFSAYAVSAVPEPGTLVLLLATALVAVLWQWWRGRRM